MQIFLIRFVISAFRFVPDSLAALLGKALGLFWFHVIRFRRELVINNLSQAFRNEKSDREILRIARANFMHYGTYFTEFLKIPSWNREDILDKVSFYGMENVDKALKKNKGLIIICGHCGNFDLMNVAQALMGLNSHVITRKARNKSVDQYWQGIREAKGVRFLPSSNSIYSILKALKRNEIVALIFDQHVGGNKGIRVNFFGRPASTMRAVALLAAKTTCPVIPVLNHKENGIEHIIIGEEIPLINNDDEEETIRLNTQNYNDILEAFIRQHPEQWLWIHRRWK